jgi:hypothetical protein
VEGIEQLTFMPCFMGCVRDNSSAPSHKCRQDTEPVSSVGNVPALRDTAATLVSQLFPNSINLLVFVAER